MMEITGSDGASSRRSRRCSCRRPAFPASPPTTPMRCAAPCRRSAFMDMHARHAQRSGDEHARRLRRRDRQRSGRSADPKVKGFIGSSQDLTAPLFGAAPAWARCRMRWSAIPAGDVLEAMKLFAATIREAEIAGGARRLYRRGDHRLAALRPLVLRGERTARPGQDLRHQARHPWRPFRRRPRLREIGGDGRHWLGVSGEYNIVEQILGQRAFQLDPNNILVDKVRRILFGKGVSVASIIHARRALDEAGYQGGADRRLVGLRSAEMPGHGGGARRRSTWSAPGASCRRL